MKDYNINKKMIQIFNQVIMPINNGGGSMEPKMLLAFFIIINLMFLFIWIYRY